jgi:hypothetical protein
MIVHCDRQQLYVERVWRNGRFPTQLQMVVGAKVVDFRTVGLIIPSLLRF